MSDQDRGRELAAVTAVLDEIEGATRHPVNGPTITIAPEDETCERDVDAVGLAVRVLDRLRALAAPAETEAGDDDVGEFWTVPSLGGLIVEPSIFAGEYRAYGDGDVVGPLPADAIRLVAAQGRRLAATPPGPGAQAGDVPEVWYSATLAHDEGFGTLPRNGLLMRDDRAYLPHHAYLAHEGTGWRRRSDLPADAVRLTPAAGAAPLDDTAVRAVLADRGYTGDEGEPVTDLLRRVLDSLGARPVDPYGTGDGSYSGGTS